MGKKLTKKEIESRIKFHKKKTKTYKEKLAKIEQEDSRVGFKFY